MFLSFAVTILSGKEDISSPNLNQVTSHIVQTENDDTASGNLLTNFNFIWEVFLVDLSVETQKTYFTISSLILPTLTPSSFKERDPRNEVGPNMNHVTPRSLVKIEGPGK